MAEKQLLTNSSVASEAFSSRLLEFTPGECNSDEEEYNKYQSEQEFKMHHYWFQWDSHKQQAMMYAIDSWCHSNLGWRQSLRQMFLDRMLQIWTSEL